MSALIKNRGTRVVGLRFAAAMIYRFACREALDPPAAKRKRVALSDSGKRRRWVFFAGFVLLAGYLLFCHGCHGDEDNELFAGLSASVVGRSSGSGGVEPTASLV